MNAQQEFDSRMAKVRQAMREQGLQTLLVFDAGRHNFLRMNYVAYLTDFIGVGPETVLVLPLYIWRRFGTLPEPRTSPRWKMFDHSMSCGTDWRS